MVLILFFKTSSFLQACTAFNFTKDGKTYVGNNEDWLLGNPDIIVHPPEWDIFGRLYVGYSWGILWIPFAGINDQGLMFDIFLTPAKSIPYDFSKPLRYASTLIPEVMRHCATVACVVERFQRYNLGPLMEYMGYQVFFTDRDGNSVVIGGGEYVYKESNFQIVTNHFLFEPPTPEQAGSVDRYNAAEDMLLVLDELTVDYFSLILDATDSNSGTFPTQYSYVFDLNDGILYFFKNRDYSNVAILNVSVETSYFWHMYKLNDLTYQPVQ